MATIMSAADNEGTAQESRITRDGRRIIYRLNLLQHPEKARACGQGAKSSTDRRPVDPPPIVDLHIFEEDSEGAEKDITFAYRANFFMWANLESVRPMAQGRGQKDAPQGPDLCGSPVSGISYLDRPKPAGFFIFPDLSIRHEGRYRLTFTLYEELRDIGMLDQDASNDMNDRPLDHVSGRVVIRTKPFTVFSAKKFPGLSESTHLSRTVAEQGCRVRIRRDVRLRKRDGKSPKLEYADDDEEDIPAHQIPLPPSPEQKHAIPAPQPEPEQRNISISNASNASFQPLQRSSTSDSHQSQYQSYTHPQQMAYPHLQQQQQQHFTAPPPPQHHDPQTMAQHHMPQAQPQMHQHFAPPPAYIQHSMAQSPQQMQQFQHQPQFAYQQPAPNQYYQSFSPQQYAYTSQPQMHGPQQPQQMVYPQTPSSHMRHDSMTYVTSPNEYQAGPAQPQYGNQAQATTTMAQIDNSRTSSTLAPNGSSRSQTANSTPTITNNTQTFIGKNLPPIQTQQVTYDTPVTIASAVPISTQSYQPPSATPFSPVLDMSQYHPAPPQYISNVPTNAPKPKRSFASSFSTTHMDQRLQGGARPDVRNGYGTIPLIDGSDDDDNEPLLMEYKRADGTVVKRNWPALRH